MKRYFVICIFLSKICFASYDTSLYGVKKVGTPYKIGKSTYTPKEYQSYQEEGFISWYGPGFHARNTANGAIFNKNSYTAAHKTLQMPAVIEITNLENGRKVIAVVNDRGPFAESQNRILDASEKVAKELGFLHAGVTRARVKYLPKETQMLLEGRRVKLGPLHVKEIYNEPQKIIEQTSPKAEEEPNPAFKTSFSVGYAKGVYVQVGAFKSRESAENLVSLLQRQHLEPAKIRTEKGQDGEVINIVRIGPIKENAEENILTKVKNLGYSNARILIIE